MGVYDDPASGVKTITPSDTADSVDLTRGLYIGTAGALKFTTEAGVDITYANAIAGYHPLRVTRVYSIGTNATDIHALY